MPSPEFLEPETSGDSSPDPAAAAAATGAGSACAPLTLKVDADEPLVITNFLNALPPGTSLKDRLSLVKAGAESKHALTDDAWHAIARAVVQADVCAALVRGNLLIEEVVETATVQSLMAWVLTNEIVPLIQPRTKDELPWGKEPVVTGDLDGEGRPVANLTLRFKDFAHLTEHVAHVIRTTRRVGAKYENSILARRVSRPILVHPATITFEDGSDPVAVLTGRDGITRIVSAWAARLTGKPLPEDVAQLMVSSLLATKAARGKKASTRTQDHARGREAVTETMRAEFALGMAGGTPSERAVRIGQTFTMPAQIIVGVAPGPTSPVSPEHAADDAIRAVVAAIHVEFRGWTDTAADVEVMDRALGRVAHAGDLNEQVAELATGVRDSSELPAIFEDPSIPATELWRAIYLVAFLCNPPAFLGVKGELRALTGLTRIEDKRYVEMLAPIIDRAWRGPKHQTLKQARAAWGNGSPIPHSILGVDWEPVPTTDFTTLVPLALAGDDDARRTLQVAGGIALVTDKVLTSNTGSKLVGKLVPYRADVHTVIQGLGGTERGLWLLAHTANAFDATRSAITAYTTQQLAETPEYARDAYEIGVPDADNPVRQATDNAGGLITLVEYEVLRTANPVATAKAESDDAAATAKAGKKSLSPTAVSVAARVEAQRAAVKSDLATVQDTLQVLLKACPGVDGSLGAALGSVDEWNELQMLAGAVFALIQGNKPIPTPEPQATADEDDGVDGDL